jgi:hypothetical protein
VVGSAASAQFGKLDERFKIQDQAKQAMKVGFDLRSIYDHLSMQDTIFRYNLVKAAVSSADALERPSWLCRTAGGRRHGRSGSTKHPQGCWRCWDLRQEHVQQSHGEREGQPVPRPMMMMMMMNPNTSAEHCNFDGF